MPQSTIVANMLSSRAEVIMNTDSAGQDRQTERDSIEQERQRLGRLIAERKAEYERRTAGFTEWRARQAQLDEEFDREIAELKALTEHLEQEERDASAITPHEVTPGRGHRAQLDQIEDKQARLRRQIAERRAEGARWDAVFAEWKAGLDPSDEDLDRAIAELKARVERLKQDEAEAPVASPEQVTPSPKRRWLPTPSLNNIWLLALVAYVPNSLLYFFAGSNPSAFPKNLAVAGWFVAVGLWSLAWWLLGKLGKRTAPPPQRRELPWQILSVVMAIEILGDRLLYVFGRPSPWTPSKIVDITVYSVCVGLGLVGLWLRGREKRAAAAASGS